MTEEEVLKIIKKWLMKGTAGLTKDRPGYIEGWFHKKDAEAFEMAIKALELKPCEDMGEISDGYHTFNELYHQRAVLFATIVNLNKDKVWKSFKHFDGKYCFDSNGDWFIVGIDTPEGSYTYHYSKEYWDMFNCKELECGKEWDGHTEKDVTRLLSLVKEPALDKIRAEVAELRLIGYATVDGKRKLVSQAVMQIIDKYKIESMV